MKKARETGLSVALEFNADVEIQTAGPDCSLVERIRVLVRGLVVLIRPLEHVIRNDAVNPLPEKVDASPDSGSHEKAGIHRIFRIANPLAITRIANEKR